MLPGPAVPGCCLVYFLYLVRHPLHPHCTFIPIRSVPERSPSLGHVGTAAVGGPSLRRVVDAPRSLPEYKVAEAVVALAVLNEVGRKKNSEVLMKTVGKFKVIAYMVNFSIKSFHSPNRPFYTQLHKSAYKVIFLWDKWKLK